MAEGTSKIIKAVIFDMNGVVVQPRYGKLYKYILEAPALIHAKLKGDRRAGKRYVRLYRETRKLDEGVIEIARKLKESGYITPALSNVDLIDIEAARELGAYANFEPLILSAEVGLEKPDKSIYELALRLAGVEPHEAVFVDNDPSFVEAAEAAGMHGIIFKDAKGLRQDLARLGISWQ